MKKLAAAILAILATFTIAPAQSDKVEKVTSLRIDADVRPAIGQFVTGDDDVRHLSYEFLITNWHRVDLPLASVEIEDAGTGKRLVRFDSKELEDPIRISTVPFNTDLKGPANRILRSGRTAVMTIDVKLPLGASVPSAIRHRIEFESNPKLLMLLDDGSESSELFAVSEPMPIDRRPPLVIGPPLRGGPWRCGNGFGGNVFNAHDAIYAASRIARMHVPQRFGCDFRLVDANGEVLRPSATVPLNNSMFYDYGSDVIAVADGLVVKTEDGIPENVPRVDGKVIMPVPLTDRSVTGNMVALKIGEGQYAFYAHLQPGSLRVKEGDRVRRGQVLAKTGNSGNSVGPHLHFQVSRGPKLNGSDFLPHVYTSYWLSGYARDRRPDPARRRRIEFRVPTDGAFMTFPSRR